MGLPEYVTGLTINVNQGDWNYTNQNIQTYKTDLIRRMYRKPFLPLLHASSRYNPSAATNPPTHQDPRPSTVEVHRWVIRHFALLLLYENNGCGTAGKDVLLQATGKHTEVQPAKLPAFWHEMQDFSPQFTACSNERFPGQLVATWQTLILNTAISIGQNCLTTSIFREYNPHEFYRPWKHIRSSMQWKVICCGPLRSTSLFNYVRLKLQTLLLLSCPRSDIWLSRPLLSMSDAILGRS